MAERCLMEGWLYKMTEGGTRWKRRFFHLKNSALVFYESEPTVGSDSVFKPRGVFSLTPSSVVRTAPVKRQFAFEIVTTSSAMLSVHADSKHEMDAWMEAIRRAIKEIAKDEFGHREETRSGWMVKRAVRSGRNWRKRFFVLRNSRLSYFEQPPSGVTDRPSGMFDIGPRTVVREATTTMGFGKKHAFYVENGNLKLHLSAPTLEERSEWISAIYLNVIRQQGITAEPAVRVALWMRQLGLDKYVHAVVVEGGFGTIEKMRDMSDEALKGVLKSASFTMDDGRRLQLAIRKLQDMSEQDFASVGGEAREEVRLRVSLSRLRRSTRNSSRADASAASNPAESASSPSPPQSPMGAGGALSKQRESSRGSIYATDDGPLLEHRLYTWGDDTKLQLGIGSSAGGVSAEPNFVQALKNKTEPVRVAAGGSVMAAITAHDGQLFTWGSGPALGLGAGRQVSSRPYLVTKLRKVCVASVAVGTTHAVAITSKGKVFVWGEGPSGQLGLGERRLVELEPRELDGVRRIVDAPVVGVACGPEHTMLLSAGGVVCSMGEGRRGRLGHGDEDSRFTPTEIESLGGYAVAKIAAGEDFSIAVTKKHSACFWWGGLGGEQGPLVPVRMAQFDDRRIDEVDAAGEIAAFLVGLRDADGGLVSDLTKTSVYTVGGNSLLLGHGDNVPRQVPLVVQALEGHGVVQVSCGPTHVAALCEDGRLLMWGEDECGQLGTGYMVPVRRPHMTMSISGYRYISVSCGVGCTAAIGQYDPTFRATRNGSFSSFDAPADGVAGAEESLVEFGEPVAVPPPPVEAMQREDRDQANLEAMMQSIAELTSLIDSDGVKEVVNRVGASTAAQMPQGLGRLSDA